MTNYIAFSFDSIDDKILNEIRADHKASGEPYCFFFFSPSKKIVKPSMHAAHAFNCDLIVLDNIAADLCQKWPGTKKYWSSHAEKKTQTITH